ncbi:hypothetical protein CBOM_01092 [Ceraceosorus bombacis]|uniref:Uncharacterized protein n=1 Tax=Ceraceosorus bombacis TaxID=401625 RepID=A0A0P1BBU1_9BASI|nr:hypothetical protein CBOM_01092 [Ceraceosorus bombacis]
MKKVEDFASSQAVSNISHLETAEDNDSSLPSAEESTQEYKLTGASLKESAEVGILETEYSELALKELKFEEESADKKLIMSLEQKVKLLTAALSGERKARDLEVTSLKRAHDRDTQQYHIEAEAEKAEAVALAVKTAVAQRRVEEQERKQAALDRQKDYYEKELAKFSGKTKSSSRASSSRVA